MVMRQIVTVVV